jgi:hypothetical protein
MLSSSLTRQYGTSRTMAHLIIITSKYIALAIGLVILMRLRVRPLVLWSAIGSSLAILLIHLYALFPLEQFGYDYSLFWAIGCDVWAGLDPYAADRFERHPFLNPPTALPLFALFAILPLRISRALWTAGNVLACLSLVPLALRALQAGADGAGSAEEPHAHPWRLSPMETAGLAICLSFSDASLMGFYVGQLNVIVTVALLAALIAQGRARPVWAGLWLYIASSKIGTMLPFLLLFLRKADRWTWLVLVALVVSSCAVTGRLTELPGRLATMVGRIQELSAPGKVNDYAYDGPRNASIIGFEALFYRLGMRDRAMIRDAQYAAVVTIGVWVVYLVFCKSLPRPAASALVSLYSALFLYHRDYDMVILVLPLVYGVCQARAQPGRVRWPFVALGTIAIAVLYLNAFLLGPLANATRDRGLWGWLVQATVLPYATWFLMIAMFTVFLGERSLDRRIRASQY